MANENNELISTRIVNGWRICMDYRRINKETRKDHFPLPFINQMLDRLAGKSHYCFLDGYSGYNQIKSIKKNKRKLHSHAHMEFLPLDECPFDYVMLQRHFNVA